MSATASAFAVVAFLVAAASHATTAEDFFSIRNENPLLRGIYLPLPTAGSARSPLSLTLTTSIENSLNVERAAGEQLLVDGEAVTWRLTADAPVSPNVRARVTVPVIHDSGGFLDSPIERWHGWFGLPKGSRPNYPKNQLHYQYTGLGGLSVDENHTGLGDVNAELGWYAVGDARTSVALWSGVEAPTGRRSTLDGNGGWDSSVWVRGAHRSSRWNLAAELGWVHAFDDRTFAGAVQAGAARGDSGFARAAATWSATPVWALRLQLEGQTARIEHTDIRYLGPSLSLAAGAEAHLTPRWRFEAGFVEDIATDTAPDFTVFVGIRISGFAPPPH